MSAPVHANGKDVTIRDVAHQAGVSAATVSRVLNGKRVDPALEAKVHEAVDVLGYRPSRVARSLRAKSSMVWGLIIGDIRNSFFTQMARGVEDVATDLGYSVVLCNSDEDHQKESRYIHLVVDERMSGCIITPADTDRTDVRPLQAAGIPLVAVDRSISGIDFDVVRLDNRQAAAHATRHLIQRGFRRVGCITGPESTTTGRNRARGYLDAIDGDDSLLRWADFHVEGGSTAAHALLSLPEPPDAILVGNNQMMIGTLRAIDELGLARSGIGLICFDELEWADFANPSLSTIGQPTYEMGVAAARRLAARIAGDESPAHEVILESRLHARDSTLASRSLGGVEA